MIAFIGMGLLGSNFVKAMLRQGLQVKVWNRTEAKARALEPAGAIVCSELQDVVQGVKRVHITVADDAAVDSILDRLAGSLESGTTIIDHTTTSASGAARRTAYWKDKGFTYLHAPVFMGPQNALDCTGYMLVSGDPEVIRKWEPELSAMTGKLLDFGVEVNKAAGIKLLGNSFLMFLTTGLSDMLALAKAMNITGAEAASLFAEWNPGAMVPARLKRILAADFDNPSWELSMARKDARLMMEEAQAAKVPLSVLPAIAATMDQWIEKGMGSKDWTIVAKDNL